MFILATSGSFLPHWDKPVGPPKCRQQKPTAARAISWDSSTAETLKSALPQELRLTAPLAPPGAAADAQRGRSRHRIYCSTRPNTKAFACKRINRGPTLHPDTAGLLGVTGTSRIYFKFQSRFIFSLCLNLWERTRGFSRTRITCGSSSQLRGLSHRYQRGGSQPVWALTNPGAGGC